MQLLCAHHFFLLVAVDDLASFIFGVFPNVLLFLYCLTVAGLCCLYIYIMGVDVLQGASGTVKLAKKEAATKPATATKPAAAAKVSLRRSLFDLE